MGMTPTLRPCPRGVLGATAPSWRSSTTLRPLTAGDGNQLPCLAEEQIKTFDSDGLWSTLSVLRQVEPPTLP